MKTMFRPNPTIRTLLVGAALMIGTLTTAHAEPANVIAQHAPATDTRHNMDSRPDWNVDYPSQLGPQGIITSDAVTIDAMPPRKTHKDSSQTHSLSD
jgi:hypothetical protein